MIIEKSSFRDNSGFIFYESGEIFRAVTNFYKENYDFLISSGLYDHLLKENLIIPHKEKSFSGKFDPEVYKVISPEKINFISYPYEWSFSELKDAALTTLRIQKAALKYGMTLKDSTAYNIQFKNSKPVLIDTLSFEIYKENEPWVAYNQFCKHFLAPLLLSAFSDVRFIQMLKTYIDGIPLDLTKKILGKKILFKPSVYMHIGLHSKFQNKYSNEDERISLSNKMINKNSLLRLADNLEMIISRLSLKIGKSEWSEYYSETHNENYYINKKKIVKDYLKKAEPKYVWDLGANQGEFSLIAAENTEVNVVSFDSDFASIENFYKRIKKENIQNILPLVLDLANPSPSIGWANSERDSFINRLSSIKENSQNTLVMALALIHHLSISNNVPLNLLAKFFSKICNNLIIEFVPKTDAMVKKLLMHRKDIFNKYDIDNFEGEFQKCFLIVDKQKAADTDRIIYLMKNKS